MLELWYAFDLVQKVLLCMAVPATVLLLVELVLLLAGLAHGAGDVDVGPDAGDVDGVDVDAGGADGIDVDAGVADVSGADVHGVDVHGADAVLDVGAHVGAQALDDAHPGHGAHHAHGELRWFTLVGMLAFFAITGWAGLALIDAALPDMLAVVLAVGLGVLAMYLCALVMRWFGQLGESGNVALSGAVGQFADAYLPVEPARAAGGKVSLTLQGRFLVLDAVTDAKRTIPTGARVVIIGLADESTVLVRPAREG